MAPSNVLLQTFQNYIEAFNASDEERFPQAVPNRDAAGFLAGQIPLIDCPDEVLTEIYYFRWWVFRKHFKETENGHIVTEFLPPVRWAGPYNSIVCPACFHIREGRWLRDPDGWLKEYIRFWLEGHGDALKYSSWLPHAVWEYCSAKEDFAFGVELLPLLVRFYETRKAAQGRSCGLYWSNDGRDGMEYSISGSGLRPTLNAYACADARAIAAFAELAGDHALSRRYTAEADSLLEKIDTLLWDRDFYRSIPLEEKDSAAFTARPPVEPRHEARELVGYIPWYFWLPSPDKAAAFGALFRDDGFRAPWGLTTAERRHPRFMEEFDHECLWNGPVWPFATSQVLVAAANLLRGQQQDVFTRADYYRLLRQYAQSQHITGEDGIQRPWIDECIHPFTGQWLTRANLEQAGWPPHKGGRERGRDYNHSLFCDLILSGLFGISAENGALRVQPLIPDDWAYFRVENLWFHGKPYCICYDKTGEHYREGAGLTVGCTA